MKWRYSGAWESYPVEDEWVIGPHLFKVVDVLTDDGAAWWRTQKADVVYVDPPWGKGLLRGYYTKAELPMPEVEYEGFLTTVVELALTVAPIAYIEGSRRDKAMYSRVMQDLVTNVWEGTYYGKNPMLYWRIGDNVGQKKTAREDLLSGVDDGVSPGIVMDYEKPTVVADLCAGRGLTARCAAFRGIASINGEMNKYRLAEAIAEVDGYEHDA